MSENDSHISELNAATDDVLKSAYFICTTVSSTRIRLARNLYAYPFPARLGRAQAAEIIQSVRVELNRLAEFNEYDMDKIGTDEAMRLQEKRLISPDLLRRKEISAAFISPDETVSVMVNEEDHLREQYILKEFDLPHAYERIRTIDEAVARSVLFAYDEKLGYLTACPSNVGTGLRASVMMFLPGLAKYKKLDELLPSLKRHGLTVRGSYGEGSAAEGYTCQISNERTLGLSEEDVLSHMKEVTLNVAEIETRLRKRLLEEDKRNVLEGCLRAYGFLMSAAELPYKDFAPAMAKIKLGAALGLFEMKGVTVKEGFAALDEFLSEMQPVTFRLKYCPSDADDAECDRLRAVTVQRTLPEIAKRTRYLRTIPFA